MADTNNVQQLKQMFEGIRDERRMYANTAVRIGNAFLALLMYLSSKDDAFLRKDREDATNFLIKFLAGLEVGQYKSGVSGANIDSAGNAEFGELVTRLKAKLGELEVAGASEFRGNLSSEDFVSGFVGGRGWSIFRREVLNALGVPETKYTGEFDDIVVRGAMRVFSMIISQLLGENDNRIFTGMMEVDHYDLVTGRVYLQTHDGKLYNPFRKDDYIMVQQYNGMPSETNRHYITKHYELIVTAAGCGEVGAGENRLDWVEFRNFVSADGRAAADVISKGDTFTRVDNTTDADRKGLIQIITVGTATPYLDVVYGMKTDPDNSLKGRLGNLQGIRHHLFGWLDGFGELLTNLYAVGDFRLRRTGESVDAKIEMLRAMFATRYSDLRYELTDADNYLYNATFDETMDGWSVQDDGRIITSNGEALLMNGNTYIADGRIAGVEQLDGRNVLHIKKSSIRQANALIRKPGTHKEYVLPTSDTTDQYTEVKDPLYMSVRFLAVTDGTLTAGMSGSTSAPGSLPAPATVAVTASTEWQELQWQGTWDGKGDFILQYTGDMYVSLLSLTDRALDDFKKEVSTQIIQTASNIRLLGTNINNLRGTVTQLGIELDAAKEQIRIYADKYDELNGTVTNLGIRLDAAEGQISIYAEKYDRLNNTVTNLGVRLDAAEGSITNYAVRINNNESAISALRIKTDSISSAVTGVQGDLATARSRIEAVAAIAGEAALGEYYYQENNPWSGWASGTEWRHIGCKWKAKVSGTPYLAATPGGGTESRTTGAGRLYRYLGGSTGNLNVWEEINEAAASVSYIVQTKDHISAVVANFDAAGNVTAASGIATTAEGNRLWAGKSSFDSLSNVVGTHTAQIQNNASAIALRATTSTVDALSGRVSVAEANIDVMSTQISLRVEKDGIISAINQSAEEVKILASKIKLEGYTTINNSFSVDVDGTTCIGGFRVSGNGLTNGPDFDNDAYVIFRNDAHKCFAGIGGNILPSASGARGVARFENFDDSGWWGYDHNFAVIIGAKGSVDNTAIAVSGGHISGLALKTLTVGHDSVTSTSVPAKLADVRIGRDVNSVYASTQFYWRANSANSYESKTREINLILPDMEPYDDGHMIFFKRGDNNGNDVYIYPGLSTRREFNAVTQTYVDKKGYTYIVFDNESHATRISPLKLDSCGDAMCLIYHSKLQVTVNNVTYYGAWLQHKFPRTW